MNGNAFSATINLMNGINTITVTATDLAGNVSQMKRTITSDSLAPLLAITDPSQDIRVTTSTYLLKGTVSDPATQVTLSLAFEGQTYNPTVVNGTFEQQLTFTTEKQYSITLTATDQAGNSQAVQRNIIFSSGTDYPIYDGNATLSCNVPVGLASSQICSTTNSSYTCQLSLGLSGSSAPLAACRIVPPSGSSFSSGTGCGGSYSGNDYVTGSLASSCTISGKLSGTLAQFNITGSVNGGNGTISCTSPVNAGSPSSCSIAPANGYILSSLTDNGTSVISGVSSGAYTIGGGLFGSGVTSDHQVIAVFSPVVINGSCGSSNGGAFTIAPVSNLCNAGSATTVSGTGPWSWNCAGIGIGTTANCSATIQTYLIAATVTGSNGTVSCITPAYYGVTSTCTVSPSSGYQLATFTDNSVDKKSLVTGVTSLALP